MQNGNCEARCLIHARAKTRDNADLACDVYLPPAEGRAYPVIVSFSPYNATGARNASGLAWARRGFAFVGADCRGRFNSGGVFTPWVNEVADARDLLDWIAAQDWCDGNIGMVGGSYVGATQLAAAVSGHPALKAAAPSAIQSDLYATYYTGGALALAFMASWHIGMTQRGGAAVPPPNWEEILRKTPPYRIDEGAGIPCASWKDIVSHEYKDAFWKKLSFEGRLRDARAGFFLQNSWFDHIGARAFSLFNEIADLSGQTCLRVGPWAHGVNMVEGDVPYGPDAMVTEDPEVDFLSALLKGRDPRTARNPGRLQIFVMGENRWRFENEWPLKRTRWTPFYLGSAGRANTSKGDGWLGRDPVETKNCATDSFTSDPGNPVPTCGGRGVGNAGQRNQSEVEKRDDVLVYTLPALTDNMEVTGPVSMTLFASATTPDADFAVKLVDVYPDGRPFNVCDGILRARFRGGLDRKPARLKPGVVYELNIDVDVTAYVFKRGHRVRVEVAGSNFPHYSRNPHTGAPLAADTPARKAVQTIYHSAEYPSCLVLPVIPSA